LKKVKKGSSIRGLYPLTNKDEKNNFEVIEVEGSHFFPIENSKKTSNLIQKFISQNND